LAGVPNITTLYGKILSPNELYHTKSIAVTTQLSRDNYEKRKKREKF